MKKRILKNTRDLAVGDVFYIEENDEEPFTVMSQGPEYYVYTCSGNINWCEHDEDVWVDAPRTTVGEFSVGERLRRRYNERSGCVFVVTAIGRETSLAARPDGSECMLRHTDVCEEA